MRGSAVLTLTAAVMAFALAIAPGTAAAQDKGGPQGKGGGRGRGGIPAPLKIAIAAFPDGGTIPTKYGCSGGTNANVSPAIQWSGAPAGTATIALIMHDPDVAIGGDDVLHWAIFNIPATATGLPENVPAKAMLDDGSTQLTNIGQSIGYFNPCPPPPTTHHYIFEFYALDQKLDPAPTSRADLLKAMTGHIRAKAVYIGTYHQ
jgi:Raf kinase inhibitor-like YbhB/YbcL family protein